MSTLFYFLYVLPKIGFGENVNPILHRLFQVDSTSTRGEQCARGLFLRNG